MEYTDFNIDFANLKQQLSTKLYHWYLFMLFFIASGKNYLYKAIIYLSKNIH